MVIQFIDLLIVIIYITYLNNGSGGYVCLFHLWVFNDRLSVSVTN